MAYVVTKPCIGTKDRSCVEVCPVDCFYDIGKSPKKQRNYNQEFGINPKSDTDTDMLMINPDECITCGACETECPVEAIYEDSGVPADLSMFVQYNLDETAQLSDAELDQCRCTSKG
jgi:NAD-dependent dihydropyrimidine dehydrogenase PreA subunit